MQQLSQHVEETDARFTPFIQEQRTASIGAWCTRRQDDVSPSPPRYAVVHSPESHFLTTIFSIAYPWIGVPLDACYFFPKFVFSHPTEESIHVHKAWRKFGMWGSLMFRSLDETEASVKLRYDGQKCPSAQLLNQRTFAEAFDLLPSEQQDAYLRDGKRLVFGADIHIPHIPLCSLLWLATPLQYRNVDANTVAISSPVLKTMPGTGKYEGRLNAKLLTIPQALEWLLIKAFM
ncbi:hypothetical protein JKP88DRAFT_244000 [Tribonema minus]|uniref:Uncharacterized protein n=1 Tax=Tribonema minus TaxID=303371 RepID=A0A835Z5R3_9STRA|nr:hypothetical protein JKP88DRAFT_244000 [Tribonema minus]